MHILLLLLLAVIRHGISLHSHFLHVSANCREWKYFIGICELSVEELKTMHRFILNQGCALVIVVYLSFKKWLTRNWVGFTNRSATFCFTVQHLWGENSLLDISPPPNYSDGGVSWGSESVVLYQDKITNFFIGLYSFQLFIKQRLTINVITRFCRRRVHWWLNK